MGGNDGGGKGRSLIVVIPFLPPSVNSLYNVIYSQRRVEKKPEVRAFCYKAKEYLRAFPVAADSLIRLDLVFAYPFNHGNGKLRRFDSQNMMKILADLVAEKGGWDDSRIKSGSWASVDSVNESVTIALTEITR